MRKQYALTLTAQSVPEMLQETGTGSPMAAKHGMALRWRPHWRQALRRRLRTVLLEDPAGAARTAEAETAQVAALDAPSGQLTTSLTSCKEIWPRP